LQIQFVDMQGRILQQIRSTKRPGRQSMWASIQSLPAGKYILNIYHGAERIGQTDWLRLR